MAVTIIEVVVVTPMEREHMGEQVEHRERDRVEAERLTPAESMQEPARYALPVGPGEEEILKAGDRICR
jgi:hypothetical protein